MVYCHMEWCTILFAGPEPDGKGARSMQQMERRQILPDVYLTGVRTDRFRTGFLSAVLVTELKRQEAAKNALLFRVLCSGTALHPDRAEIEALLESLYGAEITPVTFGVGEWQCAGLTARFPEDAFVPGGRNLERTVRLLGEMLTAPETRGGMLRPDEVELEKARLTSLLRQEGNDPVRQALRRLDEEMCRGERFSIPACGEEKSVSEVGYQGLSKHFRRLFAASRFELFYCGSAAFDRAAELFGEALSDLPRGAAAPLRPAQVLQRPRGDVRVFREPSGTGSAAAIGYRIGATPGPETWPVMSMLHEALFSSQTGLVQSALEAMELPFRGIGRTDVRKAVLRAAFPAVPGREEETLTALKRAVSAAREIDGETVGRAKRSLSVRLRRSEDLPERLFRRYLEFALGDLTCTVGEYAGLCDCVTAEEVQALAASLGEDAELILGGEEAAV